MENIFFKKPKDYTNSLNPIKNYLEQLISHISIRKGISKEEAKPIAIEIVKKYYKDREVKYFERNEVGDREVKVGFVGEYIRNNVKDRNVLAPTFTSYCHADVKKSVISEFISKNVAVRSVAKKEGQAAKAAGNLVVAEAKNNEQNVRKTYNNSASGLFAQTSSVIANPTGHSTLTSITRTMTSLSNACNERLIAGNRYLPRAIDVYHQIAYEATYVDVDKVKATVELFGIHLPTVEDTISVLRYSSDLYFIDNNYYDKYIRTYLENLTPYHRAAICYGGDLYHLRKFNPHLIRSFLSDMIEPKYAEAPLEDVGTIYKTYEPIRTLVHSILYADVKGKGTDYPAMNSEGAIAASIVKTHDHVIEVINGYKEIFQTFFMTTIVPINSHRLREMRRRVVILSDTDSSCFTLDEWVEWYGGEYILSQETIALASAVTYIASEAIVNQLFILSRSMNVDDAQLGVLQMKNEYLWLAIAPAEVSKHYLAWTAIQEGNVFKQAELELKGVHLKNSAVPVEATKHAKDLIISICKKIENNEKLNFRNTMRELIGMEERIVESIRNNETTYFKRSKIKDATSYSQDATRSPYARHTFWNEIFGPKYGLVDIPPYDVVKIPTVLTKKAALIDWIKNMEDRELAARLDDWRVNGKASMEAVLNWIYSVANESLTTLLKQTYSDKLPSAPALLKILSDLNEQYIFNEVTEMLDVKEKTGLPTLYININHILANGIPKEIMDVIDIKRIIFDCTMQHRIIAQMLGLMIDENLTLKEQFVL